MPRKGYKFSPTVVAARLGRKVSPAAREKIAAFQRGRTRSPETRAKIGAVQAGSKNTNWRGGRKIDGEGYVHLLRHNHPFVRCDGYVFEHRLAMEAHLGRTLLPTEVVHHINGIAGDNRIENLMLFSSVAKHVSCHRAERSGQ